MPDEIDKRPYIIAVGIYINGKDLDPDLVTRALKVTPSKSFRRGDQSIGNATRNVYSRKQGAWIIETDTESSTLFDHLSELSSKAVFTSHDLNSIPGIDDAYIDIFISRNSDNAGGGTCEFEIRPSHLSDLQKVGLPINFTVCVTRA